jgi:hypothetical protein
MFIRFARTTLLYVVIYFIYLVNFPADRENVLHVMRQHKNIPRILLTSARRHCIYWAISCKYCLVYAPQPLGSVTPPAWREKYCECNLLSVHRLCVYESHGSYPSDKLYATRIAISATCFRAYGQKPNLTYLWHTISGTVTQLCSNIGVMTASGSTSQAEILKQEGYIPIDNIHRHNRYYY